MDKEKQLVMVKGIMDVKKFVESLLEKLKCLVEIVLLKKDKDKENECGDKKKGGGGKDNKGGEGVNMMEYVVVQFYYELVYYLGGLYGYYLVQVYVFQMFSDENLNVCVVM